MEVDVSRYRDLFITESAEHLQAFNEALLQLEREDETQDAVEKAFRAVHTLKGMAGTMGFSQIVTLAHSAESLLSRFREAGRAPGRDFSDLLFQSADALQRLVADMSAPVVKSPREESRGEADRPDEILEVTGTLPATVRVRASYLDQLLNLVSALIISRSRMGELYVEQDWTGLGEALNEDTKIVGDLRDAVLQARTLAVGQLFHRFPRMIRDLAREQGKEVEVKLQGLDIEFDRGLLEQVAEVLLHLLRNAVDHGIESRTERRAAGKPERGLIRLSARRESGHALIIVTDDGRGLDHDAIVARAQRLGILATADDVTLDDNELLDLICRPGFTSAAQVSLTSGRGVGLDVVRKRLEAIGGRVEVESTPGRGTRFTLSLPLTLAIVTALLVAIADDVYAVPTAGITSTIEIESDFIEEEDGVAYYWWFADRVRVVCLASLFQGQARARRPERAPAILVNAGGELVALVVDRLINSEQIVVKQLPGLLRGLSGVAGATIVGDGRVVLILDPEGLTS
ncbi:MAG: chemotaxis protein CheA [Chloroflexi bacterium]|nr:chemotaxis protein CheA [Chloroflexota bacterium]